MQRGVRATTVAIAAAALVLLCSCAHDGSGDTSKDRTSPVAHVDLGPSRSSASTTTSTTPSTTPSPPAGGPHVVWSADGGPVDSIVATDDLVIVNGDGGIGALDRRSGRLRWEQEVGDDGESTPGVTADGTVVYTPFDAPEYAVAFDTERGRRVPVPTSGVRASFSGFDADQEHRLAAGYRFASAGLTYRGRVLFPFKPFDPSGDIPTYVQRVDGFTVINDTGKGIFVVDDGGRVLLHRGAGDMGYGSPAPVYDIGHHQMATATSNGVLYVVDLRPADLGSSPTTTTPAGEDTSSGTDGPSPA